jgi:prepilin-type N-terminal cleavage/methylation domain-containing protein
MILASSGTREGHMKGFTLIELLVVIAIIGVLSSVVLASLNTARTKGADTAVKSNMANVRAQAELIYDTDSDYDAVCGANSTTQSTIVAGMLSAAGTAGGGTAVCGKPATGVASAWAASAPLKTSGHYCVDSTGAARSISAAISATTVVCPAS